MCVCLCVCVCVFVFVYVCATLKAHLVVPALVEHATDHVHPALAVVAGDPALQKGNE